MTCLEIKVVYKMRQKCFLKSRLKSALIFEVKFMSCLKIKVKFLAWGIFTKKKKSSEAYGIQLMIY